MSEDIARDYQRKNNDGVRNLLANTSVVHLLIFFGAIALIFYISSQKDADPKWNWLMYGFLVVIILVLYFKQGPTKRLLPRGEVVKIANAELQQMVREGKEIAYDSRVYITKISDLKSKDDLAGGWSGYTHYEVGFVEMVHGSQFKKDGIIKIHAYDGTILGIHDAPLGFSGNESASTVRTIPVAVFQGSIGSDDVAKDGSVKR